ncbi:MAG: hypothetical protein ACREJO_13595, partial [Phycisphaerales bacterium]
ALDDRLRVSYDKNAWGNSSSPNPYTAPGLHELEMFKRDCRGTPERWMDQRDGWWDFDHPMNGLFAPEVVDDETTPTCQSDQR